MKLVETLFKRINLTTLEISTNIHATQFMTLSSYLLLSVAKLSLCLEAGFQNVPLKMNLA